MNLFEISEWMKVNKLQSVCIEAAHIYMNEKPNESHDLAAQIAGEISKHLKLQGCKVSNNLFIDDYHPKPEEFTLCIKDYLSRLATHEFAPDIITYESALKIPAHNLAKTLDLKKEVTHSGEKTVLNHKKILLLSSGSPTCNLLDAAFYVAKLSIFEVAITVLPVRYEEHQAKVRKILRKLGYGRPKIVNIFFTIRKKLNSISHPEIKK